VKTSDIRITANDKLENIYGRKWPWPILVFSWGMRKTTKGSVSIATSLTDLKLECPDHKAAVITTQS
jgi:hypothetical protein